MLKFAYRNLSRHRARTLLTLGAIAFGVVSLVLSAGFVDDIFVNLRENTVQSGIGHLQIARQGYFEYRARQPYDYMIDDPAPLVAAARAVPTVRDAMLRLNLTGTLSNGRGELPVMAEGIEPEREEKVGGLLTLVDGRRLTGSDEFAVELGEGLARSLGVGPGAFVTLLLATPAGAINSVELKVVGVFRSFSIEFDARAARLPLAAARTALNTQAVHTVVVVLENTAFTNTVAARLQHDLGSRGYELRTWEELADFYRKAVDLYRTQFGVLQAIILVMVALSVSNSINISIFERTAEVGTLLALGNRRRQVFHLLILESSIAGLVGGLAGAGLGVGLAYGISQIGIPMPPPPNSSQGYLAVVRIVPEQVAIGLAIGVVATVLASMLPAFRVTRLPVVEALRRAQ